MNRTKCLVSSAVKAYSTIEINFRIHYIVTVTSVKNFLGFAKQIQ